MISLKTIKSTLDDYKFLLALQFCLIVATGIDFIVHSTLYNYGLIFSYNWANPYWALLTCLFFGFAFCSVTAYNMDRVRINKTKSILVFLTVIGEYYGGLLDTLWFVICRIFTGNWGSAFQNWTWHPYSNIGFYNLYDNIILNIIVIVILSVTWGWVLKKNQP